MLDTSAVSFSTHLSFPSIHNDHSGSGVCSPTLWSPRHRPEDYWSLSPDSKAQAIARGQRELMDMVSKMPESCYELSMKDIVEVRDNEENHKRVFDELPKRTNRPSKVVRKIKSDKWGDDTHRNSGVNETGFLLKMMLPINLSSKTNTTKKKKKKKNKDEEDSAGMIRVSARPSISDESVRVEDKDWWNRLSESSGSGSTKRSGSISTINSNRSRNSRRDENSSCLSFLWSAYSRD